MKKTVRERPPARKLNREELDTGVLAAGCGTQGCLALFRPGAAFINPAPLVVNPVSFVSLLRFR